MDKQERSKLMSKIKSKNTSLEIKIRKKLHAEGFRYRLHKKNLPGKPDLVFPKHRAVVFINGCFWHGHDCELFRLPKTRPEFWKEKIDGNRQRDNKNINELLKLNWRVCVVWECLLRNSNDYSLEDLTADLSDFLQSQVSFKSISNNERVA